MCLEKVHKKPKQWKEGWKVFEIENGRLYPWIMAKSTNGRRTFPVGIWFRDKAKKPLVSDLTWSNYPTGFHFFKSRAHARGHEFRNRETRKVKVRNVVATGEQGGKLVGVARELFIEDN